MGNIVRPCLCKKKKKPGMVDAPVIPVTREAEAGELPETRRQRLQRAEIMPLHSSLDNKSKTPSQKKKEEAETEQTARPL